MLAAVCCRTTSGLSGRAQWLVQETEATKECLEERRITLMICHGASESKCGRSIAGREKAAIVYECISELLQPALTHQAASGRESFDRKQPCSMLTNGNVDTPVDRAVVMQDRMLLTRWVDQDDDVVLKQRPTNKFH